VGGDHLVADLVERVQRQVDVGEDPLAAAEVGEELVRDDAVAVGDQPVTSSV
jgi:hypothetical protein